MSKLRLFILFILMSIMHSMYGQNRCLRDSLFQILQKEHINSFSFAMYYNTRDHGVGSEVNPESWTQLKGSNEKGI